MVLGEPRGKFAEVIVKDVERVTFVPGVSGGPTAVPAVGRLCGPNKINQTLTATAGVSPGKGTHYWTLN